ncbi:hypothetical protein ABZX40_13385 [Streptomyces sp. NPDC004610]|uniref:hypothetical protein n=1 Tax=unclassified Streptomyces TaxID=2593676 RepID=UPI0033B5AEF3
MPSIVRGICPGCHFASLGLDDDGNVHCSRSACPAPDVITSLMHASTHRLPVDVVAFLDPAPYLCVACQTAERAQRAHEDHPERYLDTTAQNLHEQCRENPFTGQPCDCGCRTAATTRPGAAAAHP